MKHYEQAASLFALNAGNICSVKPEFAKIFVQIFKMTFVHFFQEDTRAQYYKTSDGGLPDGRYLMADNPTFFFGTFCRHKKAADNFWRIIRQIW